MGGYGFQTWREASELRRPVGEQRGGGHQKAGCSGAVRLLTKYEQQRQHLNGLAQSHVIGQAGPQADDMGLDKTIQVLALLLVLRQQSNGAGAPSLLVAPASLLANWASELGRFAPSLKAVPAHPSEIPAED